MPGPHRRSRPVLQVDGRKSQVDIFVGRDGCPRSAPVVVGAAAGGFNHEAGLADQDLRDLFQWMNSTPDGAWVGVAGPARMTSSNRPFGFIQSNTSQFYDAGHSPWGARHETVWKDFYFQTLFTLVDQIDEAFRCEDIEILHPTLNTENWSPSMQAIVLDALGHLAETRSLSLKRVYLSCPHGMSDETLREAAMKLNSERKSIEPPRLREPQVDQISPASLGMPNSEGVSLWKVEINRQEELSEEGSEA